MPKTNTILRKDLQGKSGQYSREEAQQMLGALLAAHKLGLAAGRNGQDIDANPRLAMAVLLVDLAFTVAFAALTGESPDSVDVQAAIAVGEGQPR